ncbi:MAG TPA: DUF1177 domain-containing protein [archaeon]|nr:DUF1177 domain-containing protein [archaeon]
MALKQVLEIAELLDSARVTGGDVVSLLKRRGVTEVRVRRVAGPKGFTDFVRARIPGKRGRRAGGAAATLGVIGRLGAVGARPTMIGLVSDADGAVAALSTALKLADMQAAGDILPGDVIVTTHVCPHAPIQPHTPVPFMGSPVETGVMNRMEVETEMDAILSIDTTKGNRIINHRGIAISPTAKAGWILRVSDDLLDILQIVTGHLPRVLPITMQDITPYGNELYHINSIMQPAVATQAPVVGVAITADVPVPGCATGASHEVDVELAVRFCVEVAKGFGNGKCAFYDAAEYARILRRYGSMIHLQTLGKKPRGRRGGSI